MSASNHSISVWNITVTNNNGTAPEDDDPLTWQLTQIFQTIITVISVPLNAVIFYLLLVTRDLRTPFNIYLMNLMAVNIVNGIFQCPLYIYAGLSRRWHLGTAWCTYHLYWGFHISPYLYNSHAIISLNRVWALVSPLSYRRHHTRRLAILTCLGVFVLVHICHSPLYLRDAVVFRLPEDKFGCQPHVHAQGVIMSVMYMGLYDFPVFVVIIVYPFIVYKHFQRKREQALLHGKKTVASENTGNTVGTMSTTAGTGTGGTGDQSAAQPATIQKQPKAKKSNGFLIVTLLTLTCAVSFVPINLFFNFQHFAPQWQTLELYAPAAMLAFLESIVDPIYFIIAMRDLRTALKQLFSCH